VSFWFKAAAMGDTAGYGLFKSSDSGEGINIGLSSSGFIYYGQTFSEFSHAVYDPGDNHLLTGWHFLVLSWTVFDNEGSPNNRYNLFIDGVQVVTDNDTQGASLFPNHNNFVIGQDNLIGSQGGQAYNGAMDDFRLTLENLDATSVSSMYNGAALVGNDVRVIYTFENEQIGDTDIIDSSTVYMPPG
jgi:hypothetical protein